MEMLQNRDAKYNFSADKILSYKKVTKVSENKT